jgi:hypothetical protein
MKSNIPYMNNDWISGIYAPPEVVRTAEMNAALELSSELIAELKAAGHLVISTPMYNFSVPAVPHDAGESSIRWAGWSLMARDSDGASRTVPYALSGSLMFTIGTW